MACKRSWLKQERPRLDEALGLLSKMSRFDWAMRDAQGAADAFDYIADEEGDAYLRPGELESAILDEARAWARSIEDYSGTIYVLRQMGFFKIGFTMNTASRLPTYRTHCPVLPRLMYTTPAHPGTEALLHALMHEHQHRGEWLRRNENIVGMLGEVFRRGYGSVDLAVLSANRRFLKDSGRVVRRRMARHDA